MFEEKKRLMKEYLRKEKITWENITAEQLKYLAKDLNIIDSLIADEFRLNDKRDVVQKRKEFGIRI